MHFKNETNIKIEIFFTQILSNLYCKIKNQQKVLLVVEIFHQNVEIRTFVDTKSEHFYTEVQNLHNKYNARFYHSYIHHVLQYSNIIVTKIINIYN